MTGRIANLIPLLSPSPHRALAIASRRTTARLSLSSDRT
nr:MAG TPA: hypothetical protein [Caudoviricetes sp.]